ncbi:hypothetical protein EV361DRAFT_1021729 [Lentinula raphanica]|nr:hypothetical protein EV361DRAFT_1021729 [Lentinula raphanica]
MPKRPNTEANGARKSKKRARKAKESSDKEDTTADNPMNVQDRSDEESENDVVDATEQVKAAREAEEKQIKKDLARRKSAVYAFFDANPEVEFDKSNEAEYIVYRCTKCKEKMRQGWKTGDKGSTGNMRDHVRRCWGEEALAAIKDSTLEQARVGVKELSKGKQTTLTAIITTVQTWYKTYSTRPPDKEKIRTEVSGGFRKRDDRRNMCRVKTAEAVLTGIGSAYTLTGTLPIEVVGTLPIAVVGLNARHSPLFSTTYSLLWHPPATSITESLLTMSSEPPAHPPPNSDTVPSSSPSLPTVGNSQVPASENSAPNRVSGPQEAVSTSAAATADVRPPKRGNRGKFQGEHLEFLQARIKDYFSLTLRHEKSQWIANLTHEWFQKYPWHTRSEPAEFAVLRADSDVTLSTEQRAELETRRNDVLTQTVRDGQKELANWVHRQNQKTVQKESGKAFVAISNQLSKGLKGAPPPVAVGFMHNKWATA